jgi:hypothetical protein
MPELKFKYLLGLLLCCLDKANKINFQMHLNI